MLCVLALEVGPYVFDVIVPTNETHARHVKKVLSDYYRTEEKYYYILLTYMNIAYATGISVTIAAATIALVIAQQILGAFQIARYIFVYVLEQFLYTLSFYIPTLIEKINIIIR